VPSAHHPNPPPSQHQNCEDGAGAVASAIKSRLGPNPDSWDTIEAHRRATSVDNYRNSDNHNRRDVHSPRQHENQGCGRRCDSDDDRDRSWSPNQRGPRAFGQSVQDVRLPSRF
jgi:hypothetical protein